MGILQLAALAGAGRQIRPGHAAVEVLRANGVEVVFGLNGDHVLKLYEGLADTPSIRHVTVKHENNAVLAAEAYGRLGMIEYMQTVVAGRQPYATEVGDVDYARLAEAAGMPGIRVEEPSQIGAAWDRALAAEGPLLVEFLAGHTFPRPSVPRLVQQGQEAR